MSRSKGGYERPKHPASEMRVDAVSGQRTIQRGPHRVPPIEGTALLILQGFQDSLVLGEELDEEQVKDFVAHQLLELCRTTRAETRRRAVTDFLELKMGIRLGATKRPSRKAPVGDEAQAQSQDPDRAKAEQEAAKAAREHARDEAVAAFGLVPAPDEDGDDDSEDEDVA